MFQLTKLFQKQRQWVAVEIQSGKKYDERSDLYSFGIVFNEIVSRSLPFTEYKEFIQVTTEWLEFKCETCKGKCVNNPPECNIVPVQVKGHREEFKKQAIVKSILEKGLRPTIPPTCHPLFKPLIEQLWQAQPKKRPSFKAVVSYFQNVRECLRQKTAQVPPWSFCYTPNTSFTNQKGFLSNNSKLQKNKFSCSKKKWGDFLQDSN